MKTMGDLVRSVAAKETNWTPEAPPCLDGIDEIELDFETTGVRWWDGDLPIGAGVSFGGRTQYLPWGHRGGGNLPEATVKEWFRREVRGKHITNLNTRFEIHMAREWGIDLEAQGNTFSDVAHQAALLDDSRVMMSLSAIVNDYLRDEVKVTVVNGLELDPRRMAEYHAGIVAVRAEADVRQVRKLKEVFAPRLREQDLLEVLDIENRLIPVTAEMEKNGARIDLELLHRWMVQVRAEIHAGLMEIAKIMGRKAQAGLFEGVGKQDKPFNPKSPRDMEKLFELLNLKVVRTEKGNASFKGYDLKAIDHPTIQKVFRVSKLIDVESKLLRYAESTDLSTGIIRYALHQLRAQKDEWDEFSGAGTISGRFSSTKIHTNPDEGLNIQQVWKPAKQRGIFGFDGEDDSHDNEIFIIRELHIPLDGYEFLSADAMQIEFRMFADDTQSERLLKVYRDNPLASYHKMIHEEIKRFKADYTYGRCKDLNFANQYGAGLRKKALMIGDITEEQYRVLMSIKDWYDSPWLAETKEINRIYDQAVPEVKPLLDKAAHLASPECGRACLDKDGNMSWKGERAHRLYGDHRGYIRTIKGRRTRFPHGKRIHKALNARIQGGAADIMKLKCIELHEERHNTGFILRWPLHDETDGCVPNREAAMMVNRILNRQSVETVVPILWEVGTGPNWNQQNDLPVAYNGKLYFDGGKKVVSDGQALG